MNVKWVLDRLQEPSTYAGVAAVLAGAFGFHVSPGVGAQVVAACVAVAGLAAVALGEKPKA